MPLRAVWILAGTFLVIGGIDGIVTYRIIHPSSRPPLVAPSQPFTVPHVRPLLTAQGWLLRNLEARVHSDMGGKKPCTSVDTGNDSLTPKVRPSLTIRNYTRCDGSAGSWTYSYLFVRPAPSAFRIGGHIVMVHRIGEGATSVTVDSRVVTCRPSGHQFLGLAQDAVPFVLACGSNPMCSEGGPVHSCVSKGSRALACSRPCYGRLSRQGWLRWNLELLLRRSFGQARTSTCLLRDARTDWDFNPNSTAGYCLPVRSHPSYAYLFTRSATPSAFRLGWFYYPGETVAGPKAYEPVLVKGRLVQCGSNPRDILFAPGLIGGQYLRLRCERSRPGPSNATDSLVVATATAGGSPFSAPVNADGFSLDWALRCPPGLASSSDRLTVRLLSAAGAAIAGSVDSQRAGRMGERYIQSDVGRVKVRAVGNPSCRWHVWAFTVPAATAAQQP